MLFASAVDYTNGLLMERFGTSAGCRKLFLCASVVINLSMLGFFKYADFLIATVGGIFSIPLKPLGLGLPVGISFFTFQTMSYSIDLYRKEVPMERNYLNYLTYVSMFPQLVAGPIVRYSVVNEELRTRRIKKEEAQDGLFRFMQGLFKKVLIANQAGALWEEIRALEERYAKAECPVVSNNSANRSTPDVPMIVPELNGEHAEVIAAQRKRLGTRRGFIAVKSNCSLQSYVPALHPLMDFGVTEALVCTYQAISGAGKTFERWPEMVDNLIPYIGGEEEKSEQEPLKVWGHIDGDKIVKADGPAITTQCLRVPVSDGHTAAVFVRFQEGKKPTAEQIKEIWKTFKGRAHELDLPSAPKQFIHYFEEPDRPQARTERELEGGMAISVGRLRPDSQYDYKFVGLSHNTLRGAAGGGVLLAELLCAEGYIDHK